MGAVRVRSLGRLAMGDACGWFGEWTIFDGDMTVIDGPFDSAESAAMAAATHRDTADPEEHYETLVAYATTCACNGEGCFGPCNGLIITDQQAWASNQPATA